MKNKTWMIFLLCGFSIGYTIVLGRFLRVEYTKLFIIFGAFFLSGYVIRDYTSLLSWRTFLFLFPGLFFIAFGVFDNFTAIVTWSVELIIVVVAFLSGYFIAGTKGVKKIIPIFASILFIVVFALVVNPRIVSSTQFMSYQRNEQIQNNREISFALINAEGGKVISEQLKGKTILLDFWFIGCAPCYDKMKYLSEIAEYYKNRRDIVIITVDVEQDNKFNDFVKTAKRFPSNLIYTYDSAGVLAKELDLKGYPTELIIDKMGKIQHRYVGFNKDIALIYSSKTIEKIESIANNN